MSEETEALAERLRREVDERNKEPDYFDHGVTQDMSDAADAIELLITSQARLSEAVKVLREVIDAFDDGCCNEGIPGWDGLRMDRARTASLEFLATLGEENVR